MAVVATKSESVCRGTVVQGTETPLLPHEVVKKHSAGTCRLISSKLLSPTLMLSTSTRATLHCCSVFPKRPHEGPKHIRRDVRAPAARSMSGNRREDLSFSSFSPTGPNNCLCTNLCALTLLQPPGRPSTASTREPLLSHPTPRPSTATTQTSARPCVPACLHLETSQCRFSAA